MEIPEDRTLDTVTPDDWRAASIVERWAFLDRERAKGLFSFLCLSCAFPTACGQSSCEACRWNWTYTESDPALMLFTAAVDRFGIDIAPGANVLELGCAETNWLERMRKMDPTLDLTGIDARPQSRDHFENFRVLQGDACDRSLFAPNSFDWIVMLGALEHFGLGFYGDPVDEDGDTRAMENVVRWLKPGGFVYFDVPCNPRYRVQENRHFRQYAPSSIRERLIVPGLQEVARAYSLPEPNAGTWCDEPTEELVPYHFVAVLAQKVAIPSKQVRR